jgi:hypothetical protein
VMSDIWCEKVWWFAEGFFLDCAQSRETTSAVSCHFEEKCLSKYVYLVPSAKRGFSRGALNELSPSTTTTLDGKG